MSPLTYSPIGTEFPSSYVSAAGTRSAVRLEIIARGFGHREPPPLPPPSPDADAPSLHVAVLQAQSGPALDCARLRRRAYARVALLHPALPLQQQHITAPTPRASRLVWPAAPVRMAVHNPSAQLSIELYDEDSLTLGQALCTQTLGALWALPQGVPVAVWVPLCFPEGVPPGEQPLGAVGPVLEPEGSPRKAPAGEAEAAGLILYSKEARAVLVQVLVTAEGFGQAPLPTDPCLELQLVSGRAFPVPPSAVLHSPCQAHVLTAEPGTIGAVAYVSSRATTPLPTPYWSRGAPPLCLPLAPKQGKTDRHWDVAHVQTTIELFAGDDMRPVTAARVPLQVWCAYDLPLAHAL